MKITLQRPRGYHNFMITPALWWGTGHNPRERMYWLGIQWLRSSWQIRFTRPPSP